MSNKSFELDYQKELACFQGLPLRKMSRAWFWRHESQQIKTKIFLLPTGQ